MTLIRVNEPVGGLAVFRHRTPAEGLGRFTVWEVPGEIDLPPVPDDHYYQVTLRRAQHDGGQWLSSFAIQPPGDGTYDLEDEDSLPRMELGEAGTGGFGLTDRVVALESQVAQNTAELGENVFARLDSHEAALGVAEDIFDDNLLGLITWMDSSTTRIDIPDYVPQGIARSYRCLVDIVTEDHVSEGDVWIRVMNGGSQVLHQNWPQHVYRSGDRNRYRFDLLFNAPANADIHLAVSSAVRAPSSGRAGYTRPVLVSPVERSQ